MIDMGYILGMRVELDGAFRKHMGVLSYIRYICT